MFLLLGVEVVFEGEPISQGDRVLIDPVLKGGDAALEVVQRRMAIVRGDVLAQPAPQGFDRHEIRAVRRQRPERDLQVVRRLPDAAGAMVTGPVPQNDQGAVGDFGAQSRNLCKTSMVCSVLARGYGHSRTCPSL